jgi:hypothetical protein
MVHATGEERAVNLAQEAVELVDAGHREVRDPTIPRLNERLILNSLDRLPPGTSEKHFRWPPRTPK